MASLTMLNKLGRYGAVGVVAAAVHAGVLLLLGHCWAICRTHAKVTAECMVGAWSRLSMWHAV